MAWSARGLHYYVVSVLLQLECKLSCLNTLHVMYFCRWSATADYQECQVKGFTLIKIFSHNDGALNASIYNFHDIDFFFSFGQVCLLLFEFLFY